MQQPAVRTQYIARAGRRSGAGGNQDNAVRCPLQDSHLCTQTHLSGRTLKPPSPCGAERRTDLHVRLNEKEAARLERLAGRCGCTKSAFVRACILNRPLTDREIAGALREVKVELARIGNNLNQIAHRWNESGADSAHLAFIEEYLGEIYRCLREVRAYCYRKNGEAGQKNPHG